MPNELTLGNRLAYGAGMAKLWSDSELESVHRQFETLFSSKPKQTVNWQALNLQTQAKLNREKQQVASRYAKR